MAIDYKVAYRELNKAYKVLLKERMECASLPLLIDWIRNDLERGKAITSFTEGPERQIAYEIEGMLDRLNKGVYISKPHIKLRDTERCPQCGVVQIVRQD